MLRHWFNFHCLRSIQPITTYWLCFRKCNPKCIRFSNSDLITIGEITLQPCENHENNFPAGSKVILEYPKKYYFCSRSIDIFVTIFFFFRNLPLY